jgi:hypothetical protein
MSNEIPHLNPSNGYATKRYYNDRNGNRCLLTEQEREDFDCCELLCGELLKKINLVVIMIVIILSQIIS